MSRVKDELDRLTAGITDEGRRTEIIRNYILDSAHKYSARLTELTDDELDMVAGGMPHKDVGDIFDDCDEENAYYKECMAAAYAIGVDICAMFCK
ncbi:MAG: hypothetical protein CW338_09955 [Clostridiales bacterium]|nr:hypothetical protein [Clostridiales bacterium]